MTEQPQSSRNEELDTAKIRAEYREPKAHTAKAQQDILALCAALDAARSERNALARALPYSAAALIERVEAAEARVTRLAMEAADREFLRVLTEETQ